MFKKIAFLSLTACSLLFGDYYSVADARLNSDKTLYFEDHVVLQVKGDDVILQTKNKKLATLYDSPTPKKYKDVILRKKVTIEDPFTNEEKEVVKDFSYPAVNFAYMLKHTFTKDFFLYTPKKRYFVKVDKENDSVYVFNHKFPVTVYTYTVKEAYNKQGKKVESDISEIMQKYIYKNSQLLAVSFMGGSKEVLHKVSDAHLKEFLEQKKLRPTEVNAFDFSHDKLYLSYVSKTRNGAKRLEATYEMSKKNMKTVLKSPISLFDPESHSNTIEQNVGILRDLGARGLFEIKKVQIINKRIDVSWFNHPKKSVVVIDYITNGEKDRNLLSKNKGEQFYGIEGVFYLPTWMKNNGVNSLVFTFINGSLPFDATMKKVAPNTYAMEKKGKKIYIFELDARGFVTHMKYPSYNIDLALENVESDATRENKKYFQQMQKQYNIVLVKE